MNLRKQFKEAKDAAEALLVTARDEERELTQEERGRLEEHLKTARDAKERMAQAKKDQEMLGAVEALGEIGLKKDDTHQPGFGKSIGERFINAVEFKTWQRNSFPNGNIPQEMRIGNSPPVSFGGMKDLITGASDTSGGAAVPNDFRGLLDGTGTLQRPLTIRDIVTVGQTGSDLIEYAKLSAFTNNAATVAEATATTGASGLKPESALTMSRETAAVKTVAHWIPLTKRALADVAQIQTIVDGFLRYGLEEELEDQMIGGNGAGENFTGIANTSGTQSQGWDSDLLTTTRKARTLVRTVGRSVPTAWLLNPADWEQVDLLQNDTGSYFFGGPTNLGTPRLWGLPVVESEAVPAGTGYVGDFRQCVLWDREQAMVQVSDSPGDQFLRNMVTVLAELRAAFGVIRPAAIVEVDLTAV